MLPVNASDLKYLAISDISDKIYLAGPEYELSLCSIAV
jgi:hypothetical protein